MKALQIIIFSIVVLLGGGGFLLFSQAQENSDANKNPQQEQSVSRFEMIRSMEEANCSNCLTPPGSWKQKYTALWLQLFQGGLGNSFDDINRESTTFDTKDYYYCVAHAGDQGWVNGYPRLTPGLCQGKFCGENNARGTELVQMIVNMIAPKVRISYPLSFQSIKNRSIASGVVNDIESLGLINTGLKRCGDKACVASSPDEFSLFMKYCRYHLKECSMQAIAPFVEGQRPIAELNVLYKANILTFTDPIIARLGSIINASDLARFLPAIKQVMNCQSLDDYDADGLVNDRDNCPDIYNPRQSNFDTDTKGDVCDDDIDGDGAMNDVGLVDDSGRMVKKQAIGRDDCPLIPTQQLVTKDCPRVIQDSLVAFDINADPIQANVGEQVQFSSELVGMAESIERDFGDGGFGKGPNPQHSYEGIGYYEVKAIAHDALGHHLVSQAEVHVGTEEGISSVLQCNPLTGMVTTDFRCFLRVQGADLNQATMLRRSWGDEKIENYPNDIANHLVKEHRYSKPGSYTITTELYFGLETMLRQQLVIYVDGENVCLVGTNACDFDKDSIPDQCDADIDGDGVLNIVGLVTKDLQDCGFRLENINTKILADQIRGIKQGVGYDNCSFLVNQDQKDQDLDGVGESCDDIGSDKNGTDTGDSTGGDTNTQPSLPEDRDGDGKLDNKDACPDIPENMNGVEDADGCPELPKSCKPGSKCSGKAPSCNTCPCPGADYASELWKGDRIRAVLLDEAGQVIYRYSPTEVIDVNIPDKMLGK